MAGTTAAARTLDLAEFTAEMERIAQRVGNVSYRTPLLNSRSIIKADVKENFTGSHSPDGTPWKGLAHQRASSKGSDRPLRDTGLLMASIVRGGQGHVEDLTDSYLVIGTNLDRARIHQYGGVITPTKAKALSIPLTKDAARAGGARNFPRDLFLWKSAKSGRAFLAEAVQKGKGKKGYTQLLFHYILLDRVVIPARPFLGFSTKAIGLIVEAFQAHFGRLLGGTTGGGA